MSFKQLTHKMTEGEIQLLKERAKFILKTETNPSVLFVVEQLVKGVDFYQQQMLSLTQQCEELRSRVNLPRG